MRWILSMIWAFFVSLLCVVAFLAVAVGLVAAGYAVGAAILWVGVR